jgi:tubulin polyglutamylase complex subunit 1
MAALPVPLPPTKMAAVEKRRPAVAPAANFPDSGRTSVSQAAAAAESEEDFLRQLGVTEMLRAALLKVLEIRPEEPIAFLAHYFENMGLRSPTNGGAGEPPGQLLLQQQRLGRALWHLRLAHHSQRCGPMADGGTRTTIPDRPRAGATRRRRGAFPGVVVFPLFPGLVGLRQV